MDINGKNTKTQKTTRKITRRSTLKYSIGSAVAENRNKKTTITPEKPVASKPKPASTHEYNASKPGISEGESSSKINSGRAMDFVALINKQTEKFKNMLFSTQQHILKRLQQMQAQREYILSKILWTNGLMRLREEWMRNRLATKLENNSNSFIRTNKRKGYILEIECLGKLACEIKRIHRHRQVNPLHIDTRDARYKDVVKTDAYPAEYERNIPMLNSETGDISEVQPIITHVNIWYQIKEIFKQKDDSQLQRIYKRVNFRRGTNWVKLMNISQSSTD
ncbi:hypothetical protein H8356DRAFT_1344539 [Neocallimastix lanati (nom. inval.)]|nr:hypothetical protein H8356DRAFT_1344539 [Neocallimastix sp. JGI-2020a]